MNRSLGIKIIRVLSILAILIFSILMLKTISQYTGFDKNVGFLLFKQKVVHNPYWMAFFYIHIFSVTLCLLAGLTQFSNRFLSENRKLHHWIGRIYVYNILFINVPACFVLGLFSNGGLIGITGFILQDILWACFTIKAVLLIKKGNSTGHRKYMILSYAITITAITFRMIKNVFYQESVYDYELFYGLNVWVSMMINLSIAFFIIHQKTLPLETDSIDKNNK
ncbi:hypothetical protein B0A69_16480 [Chryseobacterium shigense]|uniref:Predicted membrane protein n=1 Tax=Chryseobacterium shigense TaxID=297244 RepID=A0A1N7HWW5_9FLAO|nr:DUF2306 domain-containing protein [Chryseobacterium shigense]PQA92014.1 hypothetical protein B0A69_16480 [Chryseobacterium shigense]SIS29316.1 Predicted membrane protein [Chryseobacterium shigense]